MEQHTADLILQGIDGAICAKAVTDKLHRMMLECSEFGQAVVKRMR